VLESGEFIRVGASKTQKTNVRVVAATNVNLLENIRRGKFREDLYYRLNTVPIAVPSLKERREDIYMLFRKFAYDFADKYRTPNIMLEDDAVRLLENYPWPGNIRELKNLADQVSLLAEKPLLNSVEMLRIAPNLNQRNLPSLNKTFGKNTGASGMDERDILYQLLFDMKKDLNDLKKLVFGLINTNDLSVPDMNQYNSLQLQSGAGYIPSSNNNFQQEEEEDVYYEPQRPMREDFNTIKPVYVKPSDDKNNTHFNNVEVVEESLSISDNEKDLIKKALKKHGGRRKEAATDLQMSERTLYRKIKQYDI
jgi:DNA-binding NtrC family response regulator